MYRDVWTSGWDLISVSWTSSRCGWLEVSVTFWLQCILGTLRSTLMHFPHPGEKCKCRRRPGANEALCSHTEKCECAGSRDEAGCAEGAAADTFGGKKLNFDSLIYTKMQIFCARWRLNMQRETWNMQTASAEQQKHETKTTFYSGGCDYVVHSVHSPTIIFYLWRITIHDYGTTSAGMITKM